MSCRVEGESCMRGDWAKLAPCLIGRDWNVWYWEHREFSQKLECHWICFMLQEIYWRYIFNRSQGCIRSSTLKTRHAVEDCVIENCSVLFTEYLVTKETSRASFWQTVYSQLRFYLYNLISHLLLSCGRRDESKPSVLTCSTQGTLIYSIQPPLGFRTP